MSDIAVRLPFGITVLAALLSGIPFAVAHAAPLTAQRLTLQGVARDANDALIPVGDIAVRIYADSLGGTPLYDSGSEFAGAIAQGIFDVTAGAGAPLMLDQEQAYFLELDAAGTEVIGDAAGGRWRFLPGGGNRARPDLEARISALEAAVSTMPGMAARAHRAIVRRAPAAVPLAASALASHIHGLPGFGVVSASGGTYQVSGDLLVQPVGVFSSGNVTVQLGPYYLFAPQPDPVIRFVRDVPGDQGRNVRVRWRRDLRERAYDPADTAAAITGYTLYRRVDPGQARARPALEPDAPAAAVVPRAPQQVGASMATAGAGGGAGGDSKARILASPDEAFALPPGTWDVLTTIPATLDSAYQTVVPTLCDSTDAGICWSVFVVRAITDRVGTFHDSGADSGYSVDNLAPGVPTGFALQPVSGGIALAWQPSTAPDFQYFRVYRSSDPNFVPGPATLVQATTGTSWTDPTTGSFTYKLTAVDFNGNESDPASASITTGVDGASPTALRFSAMAPNPFRGSLNLTIEVPAACGPVELAVFDVTGRRVRTIASRALPAGRYTFTWNGIAQDGSRAAAGVYVVRLRGAGKTFTRRAALLP